jgi:isopentenyldiphosphate isomerase
VSADELVDLVDEHDRVIGQTTRREVRSQNLRHRGVGILCWNPRGEVYVHQRTATKDVFPALYDMFVGGVVGAGEAYAPAAKREVAEELGISGPALVHLFDHLYQGPHNHAWVSVFEVTWDGPIVHQPSEVQWGQWMTLEAVVEQLPAWDWVPDGLEIFLRYLRERHPALAARAAP